VRVTYNKLVRDRIPEHIAADGKTCQISRIDDDLQFRTALKAKLLEEAQEVIEADGDELLTELADVLEVIRSLTSLSGDDLDDLVTRADSRASDRGGFAERLWLEYVDDPAEGP